MIIGITGTLGAGKGTIVEFLKERGFLHYSVREFLIEEISKRGLKVSRDSMVLVANDLRAKFGASYIVEKLYARAKERGGDVVIESVRCVGEVEALRNKADFVFWAVDADVESRYSRIVERGGSTDRISFQDFVKQESLEMENTDSSKQNLKKCIELADVRFRNDWTKDELKGKVERVLDSIEDINKDGVYVRPTWDEYFMEVCDATAKRTTCDRARAGGGGCVIVRDKHLLVSGYVGSPPGCDHCDDVGHQFKKTIHEGGSVTNHCVRTIHAEQNAICQAAKLGISLDGGTLYCFMFPCYTCAKMIVSVGIKRVVVAKDYHASKDSKDIFEKTGVKFEILNKEVQQYDKM